MDSSDDLPAFASSYRELVALLYEGLPVSPGDEQDRQEYVLSPERVREAAAVSPVIEGYLDLELNPDESRGVGQAGMSLFKPLGPLMAKRCKSQQDWDTVRHAASMAVAMSYAMTAEIEASGQYQVSDERSNEDIWNLTVTGYRTNSLLDMGFPSSFTNGVEQQSERVLLGELRKSGLLGHRVGKVRYCGKFYGLFGALVRIGQTDMPITVEAALVADVLGPTWAYPGERTT